MNASQKTLLLILSALAVFGCSYQGRVIADALSGKADGRVLWKVRTAEKAIAITIDDGPDARETPLILDALAQHNARATFFMLGTRVEGNEDVIRRIVAEGHEIGNHLMSQQASISLSRAEFERRLVGAHKALSAFAPVQWFRPGSAWYDDEMLEILARHGYRCAVGRVHPFDGRLRSVSFAATWIRWMTRPGSIVILHDIDGRGDRTAETLLSVLPALTRRGYRFLTLSDLVEVGRGAD